MTDATITSRRGHPIRAAILILILPCLALAAFATTQKREAIESAMTTEISSMLDQIDGNRLDAAGVTSPLWAALPFSSQLTAIGILPAEFSGRFRVAASVGNPLSGACAGMTFGYRAVTIGGNTSLEISPADASAILACEV